MLPLYILLPFPLSLSSQLGLLPSLPSFSTVPLLSTLDYKNFTSTTFLPLHTSIPLVIPSIPIAFSSFIFSLILHIFSLLISLSILFSLSSSSLILTILPSTSPPQQPHEVFFPFSYSYLFINLLSFISFFVYYFSYIIFSFNFCCFFSHLLFSFLFFFSYISLYSNFPFLYSCPSHLFFLHLLNFFLTLLFFFSHSSFHHPILILPLFLTFSSVSSIVFFSFSSILPYSLSKTFSLISTPFIFLLNICPHFKFPSAFPPSLFLLSSIFPPNHYFTE